MNINDSKMISKICKHDGVKQFVSCKMLAWGCHDEFSNAPNTKMEKYDNKDKHHWYWTTI